MNEITFPLKTRMQSAAVRDLQDALLLLLDRGVLLPNDETARGKLAAGIRPEQKQQLFGKSTATAISIFQREQHLQTSGEVDEPTAVALNRLLSEFGLLDEEHEYSVSGKVAKSDGVGISGLIVRAFDRDLRNESFLGETKTDDEGLYEIPYLRSQFTRADKGTADLVIRVFGRGDDNPIASSDTFFNVPAKQTIDMEVDAQDALSEIERYETIINPCMQGLTIDQLDEDQLWFLSGECNLPASHLAFMSLAYRYGNDRIPPEAFYGMFRQGLPTNLTALQLRSSRLHREALVASLEQNIIPASFRERLEAIITSLGALLPQILSGSSSDRTPSLIGELLDIADLDRDAQEKALRVYAEFEGTNTDLARALKDTLADEEAAFNLDLTFRLALLTRLNVPLVRTLRDRITTFDGLVDLDDTDWHAAIPRDHDGRYIIPEEVVGDSEGERVDTYVRGIRESLELAIPMAYIQRGVAKDPTLEPGRKQDLERFFTAVKNVDLSENHIESLVTEHATLLRDIDDRDALVGELQKLQRVFRIAPRNDHMRVLLEAGFDSSLAVADTPLTTFVETLGDKLGGPMQTCAYYDAAQQASAVTTAVYAALNDQFNSASPDAAGQGQEDILKKFPNLEGLFGSLDLCECKHCRSVYGPAAYFVDILQFLRKSGAVYGKLTQRRPDLEHIQLTCENSHTPIPYVDLVNEILEFYVVHGEITSQAANDTQGATAEELRLQPQHIEPQAYDSLKDAAHGMLPFDLPLATARTYLEHLGTSLYTLMDVFGGPAVPGEFELSCEFLNISRQECAILLGQSSKPIPAFYGYSQQALSMPLIQSGSEGSYVALLQRKLNTAGVVQPPLEVDGLFGLKTRAAVQAFQTAHSLGSDGIVGPLTWAELKNVEPQAFTFFIGHVPEFLKRAEISYTQLVELLKTRYVNAGQSIEPLPGQTVVLYSPDSVCDLALTRIEHLDGSTLAEDEWLSIHQFLRLWKKTGWSMQELDKTFVALGKTEIDSDFLIDIARIEKLRRELRRPVAQLLSLWATLDTFGPNRSTLPSQSSTADGSLYDQLFLNKAVLNPPDEIFQLTSPPAAPEIAQQEPISAHEPALLAAFGVNASGLALLRQACGLADASQLLTLDSVSRLYRHAFLARAVKRSVADYVALLTLFSIDPIQTPTPADTEQFVERANGVRESAFHVSTLNYLYRHVSDARVALLEDDVKLTLEQMRTELLAIQAETQLVSDPTGELLERKLALVFENNDVVGQALGIINGTSLLPQPEQSQFIDDHFVLFVDPTEAKAVLLAPPSQPPEQQADLNRTWVLTKLLPYLRQSLSRSLIKQSFSDATGLDAKMVRLLLEELDVLSALIDNTQPAIADFMELTLNAPPWSEVTQGFVRMHKIGLLVDGFDMTVEELKHFTAQGVDFNNFNLNDLPLTRDDPEQLDIQAGPLFTQWEALASFFRLKQRAPQGDLTLLDVISATSASEAQQNLVSLTGWDAEAVGFLAGAAGWNLPEALFRTAEGPSRIERAIAMARRLGISVTDLHDFATNEPDSPRARRLVHAVKARYDDDTWPAVAKPLNDSLRDKRRAALVSYLLAEDTIVSKNIDSADRLYEYFLIDVQMNPCFITSRLKQAAASVQLFVQRCLMNLEEDVSPASLDSDRWKWMKNYRVWEANRKVFLYPENWIEPELRDDKTPFFKDIENHLLEGPLTEERVERGLLDYLEKLDHVADLEYTAQCRQRHSDDGETVDLLHIFARTRNTPRKHYYRRYDIRTGQWSPWEQLPLDIKVDLISPVIWNRRLYLFWPEFQEKPDLDNHTLTEDEVPRQMIEIMPVWSEYRDGRWSSQTMGNGSPVNFRFFYHSSSASSGTWEPKNNLHQIRFLIKRFATNIAGVVSERLFLMVFAGGGTAELYSDQMLRWYYLGSSYFDGCAGRFKTYSVDFPIWWYTGGTRWFSKIPGVRHTYPRGVGFDSTGDKDESFYSVVGDRSAGSAYDPLQSTRADYVLGLETVDTLASTDQGRFRVIIPQVHLQFLDRDPFIFQEGSRSYLVLRLEEHSPISASAVEPSAVTTFHRTVRRLEGSFHTDQLSPEILLADSNHSLTRTARPTDSRILEEIEQKFSGSPVPGRRVSAVEHVGYELTRKGPHLWFTQTFHPHVCAFIKALNAQGIDGLLSLNTQRLTHDPTGSTRFKKIYDPTSYVHPNYPRENVDFDHGAYSVYNWELFFHIPMLIADRKSADQRFEEAERWYRYIFDPTSNDSAPTPSRYWKFLPFRENDESGRIVDLLEMLRTGKSAQRKRILQQIEQWRDNPFNPHLIARSRMVAYQKNVAIKYIDNLIAWADNLFRRDTIESINEATQLYVLAAEILGPRPADIPRRGTTKPQTFNELKPKLDGFSNARVALENEFPFASENTGGSGGSSDTTLGSALTFYFCIPKNENLLKRWDTVEDRLFKIRHCMNIEGVVRTLPLFEPPIDPALLVRATAMGIDLESVLNGLYAPLPKYRFGLMLQRALELCTELKSLGNALLQALEKKDAEALNILRAKHETALLEVIREVKKHQYDEAIETRASLIESKNGVDKRKSFYKDRITKKNKKRLPSEILQIKKLEEANDAQQRAELWESIASLMHIIPNFSIPLSPPGGASMSLGGSNVGNMFNALASQDRFVANHKTHTANMASIDSTFIRRDHEWQLQFDLAMAELAQLDKQIAAADIRIDIADQEKKNHELQIEQSKSTEEFLRRKYTNEDLYRWTITQISTLFFQTYNLAYDTAKRAERAYQFELGLTDSNFIQFGYWDSLHKGLLSGERLHLDLKRMEMAYIENNKREYELTKHVSIRQLDPMALLALKATGACEVTLPEWLFDLDGPGHYMRRIKSVSLSIPSVAGPYTSINCTLSLLKSSVRKSPLLLNDEYVRQVTAETRFVDDLGTIQSVVTSSADNDSGMFETNLRDERYLPFEGAGAESNWRLELPEQFRQFDYNTISDVVLHVNYTARQGGNLLRQRSVARIEALLAVANEAGMTLLLSLKHDFAGQWRRFVNDSANFSAQITRDYFPYFTAGKELKLDQIHLVRVQEGQALNSLVPPTLDTSELTTLSNTLNDTDTLTFSLPPDDDVLVREQEANVFVLIQYSIIVAS
ncbi:MAG: hypothetical protein GY801_18270 [bacterium]|nr:hypothetical protein [bacterium]